MTTDIKEMAKAEFIAEQLSSYEPGYLPEPLFFAISHLAVLTGIEVVPVLKETGDVLLVRRPETDPYWPNALHFPGTILIPTDWTVADAIQRVLSKELFLDEATIASTYDHFVFDIVSLTTRGRQMSHVHTIRIDHIPEGFRAFDPRQLPEDVINHHRTIINIMVAEGRWL